MRRVAIGLVLAGSLLASCSGSGDGDDAGSITVFGPWVGTEADAMAEVLDGFDAEVRYIGSGDFVTDLNGWLASGVDRPDIAFIPQPALIDELVESDDLVPLSESVVDAIADGFAPGSWERAEDGSVYSLPYRANVKSLVWFRPEVFEANGWSQPSSLDELDALVAEVESTTDLAPWCFSVFAGGETGWPATDWIEDLLLRQAGPDVYDGWVSGDVPFTDQHVERAFESFEQLVLANGRSLGGRADVLQVEVARAPEGLFTPVPGCAMYKQASFATSWFPDGTTIGEDADVDFFTLPGATVDEPAPLLTAGTAAVQLSDRSEVNELMEYLASPDGSRAWAERGGYVSARTNVDAERYYTGVDARFSELLQEAPVIRFDASDQFDSTVRQAVLTGITSWIAGRVTLDELLASLDEVAESDG
jgi:alpha-glucoside transport system substrate-binding protein